MKEIFIIGLCLSLIGCAPAANEIVKPYADPHFGMTKLEMFNLLGKPESVEIYQETNETRKEFYFYIKDYASSPADSSLQQEKVPVCVINNKVVGWGKTFYEDHLAQDDVRIK